MHHIRRAGALSIFAEVFFGTPVSKDPKHGNLMLLKECIFCFAICHLEKECLIIAEA